MNHVNFFILLFIIILIYISYKKNETFSNIIEYIKHERNIKCVSNYKSSIDSNLNQCKSLCTNDLNCKAFTFSENNGCRYSFCNENSNNIKCRLDKQCDTDRSSDNDFLYIDKKSNYGYIQRKLDSVYYSFRLHKNKELSNKAWNKTQKMQILIYQYLPYDSIVLEINGNLGSLSILVNLLIKNPNYHFVTEMDEDKYKLLKKNKEKNNLSFKPFHGAISNKRVIYKYGFYGTFSSKEIGNDEVAPEDWIETNTITYLEANEKCISVSGRDINTLILKETDSFLMNLIKNNENFINKIKVIIIEYNIFLLQQKELEDFLKEKGYIKIACFCEKGKEEFYNKKCHYAIWKYKLE